MTDAASFDAIMQCNLLEVFCEALGAAIFVTDKLDNLSFASIKLLQFFPLRDTAIEPGKRARDLYGAMYDAGCRFGGTGLSANGGRSREEWIAERVATAWKERTDTIEQVGAERWMRIVSRRFSSGLGMTIMQDISDHKKKETSWRADQDRVRMTEEILDTLPVAIAIKDRNLNFAAVNQEFCRLHGTSPDDVLGRSIWDFVRPELAGEAEEADWQLLASGGERQTVISIDAPDGGQQRMLHRARRIGKPGQHYLSMSFDSLDSIPEGDVRLGRVLASHEELADSSRGATPAAAEVPIASGKRRVVLVAAEDHSNGAAEMLARTQSVDLCILRDARELAAFLPAAREAGLAIDLVLLDGDVAAETLDPGAAAGIKVRTISPGWTAHMVVSEIQRYTGTNGNQHHRHGLPSGPAGKPGSQATRTAPARTDVLAIEDNPINRMALEQIFETLNVTFAIAATGAEGIALAAELSPQLIVADLTLPDIAPADLGRALVERAATQSAPSRLVAMLVTDSPGEQAAAAAAGFAEWITKPLSPDMIGNLVKRPVKDGARAVSAA